MELPSTVFRTCSCCRSRVLRGAATPEAHGLISGPSNIKKKLFQIAVAPCQSCKYHKKGSSEVE
ncbi:uncharacterized protein LOC118738070 isoform X4 [Rhagoletis pomonella]|uniref:uncharacterized protein LOC118738070 isoform X4 n=1 Tax=Rhagoletis pomonella TaxID=28610 RepID=UPI001785E02D|nr:uncharacterized protein LOC118738070 isoform X4 [Rhagoletis pomonella]